MSIQSTTRYNTTRSQAILLLALTIFFYLTAAPAYALMATEEAKLLASDGMAVDFFGTSVSIDNDRAVIGVRGENGDEFFGSGSAYVFERDGSGNWIEVTKLLASDRAGFDLFGRSVSIDGDRIVIGAHLNSDNGSSSGSAYVFERDGSGNWIEVAKLLASDAAMNDVFGTSVSIDGNYVVIGAAGDDDKGSGSGSAYVFERDGSGNWIEVAKLLASDGTEFDGFGATSISIDDDRVVIGVDRDDDNGNLSGSAYVFKRDASGSWIEEAKLLASDGQTRDSFGESVSLDSDRIVIGAIGTDDNGGTSGSAYMFELDGTGNWIEVAKLLASDGMQADQLGRSVSIDGDRVVIGASGDNDNGVNSGSAYVFERDGSGDWIEVDKLLASDGVEADGFGGAVSIDGVRVVISARRDDDNGILSGSVYVFNLEMTPSEATQNLINAIKNLGLANRVERSLLALLKNVSRILTDNNPRNDGVACNNLSTFIAIVNGKERNGQLNTANAKLLRETAQDIKNSLGCHTAACRKLTKYIAIVDDKESAGKMRAATAARLRKAAQDAKDKLGCP